MDATIVDLRYRMKEVLRAIDRGETVTVLYRGKAKAKLTPVTAAPHDPGPKTADQPFFGLWRDREEMRDPELYIRNLRRSRFASTGKSKPRVRRRSK